VGRLCTRGKYLEIKGDAHELFWGISAFLPEEFKSLKKKSVDLFLIVKLVKEEDRGEKEFRAFNKIISFTASITILFILSSKMLRALRLFRSLIFLGVNDVAYVIGELAFYIQ
jgi:hypothetical protein